MDRSKKENAIAGKLPRGSKEGRGKNRKIFLTGDIAKILNREEYDLVKMSDLTDGEIDKLYARLVEKKKASPKLIAQRVAKRLFKERYSHLLRTSYEAQGALHKMIGEIISRQIGLTDAPEDFFVAVENLFKAQLEDNSLEMDLDDPDVYPVLRRAINETLENMDLPKK